MRSMELNSRKCEAHRVGLDTNPAEPFNSGMLYLKMGNCRNPMLGMALREEGKKTRTSTPESVAFCGSVGKV